MIKEIKQETIKITSKEVSIPKSKVLSNTICTGGVLNTKPVLTAAQRPMMPFKKIHPDAIAPAYAHEGDSGMDLYTVEDVILPPKSTKIAPTGIAVALPPYTELQVRNRSGITVNGCLCRCTRIVFGEGLKKGHKSMNKSDIDELCYERVMLGTVDNGYRGEIGIMVYNQEHSAVTIPKGTKLAQAVVCPVITVNPVEVDELPETDRGANGYGSTGI